MIKIVLTSVKYDTKFDDLRNIMFHERMFKSIVTSLSE